MVAEGELTEKCLRALSFLRETFQRARKLSIARKEKKRRKLGKGKFLIVAEQK